MEVQLYIFLQSKRRRKRPRCKQTCENRKYFVKRFGKNLDYWEVVLLNYKEGKHF